MSATPDIVRPMLIYVAGAYTAPTIEDIERNIRWACNVGRQLMHLGHHPLVPHSMYAFWDRIDPRLTYEHFIAADLHLLSRCDALCMVPNWESSPGSCGEYTEALSLGLRIYLSTEDVPLVSTPDQTTAQAQPPLADTLGDTCDTADAYLPAFNILSQRLDVLRARLSDLRRYPRISSNLADVIAEYEREAQSCEAAMQLLANYTPGAADV